MAVLPREEQPEAPLQGKIRRLSSGDPFLAGSLRADRARGPAAQKPYACLQRARTRRALLQALLQTHKSAAVRTGLRCLTGFVFYPVLEGQTGFALAAGIQENALALHFLCVITY